MHSPFVFDFIRKVLNNGNNYQAPIEVEQLRKQLLSDHRILEIEDFGAGSRISTSKKRTIAEVVRTAVKSKRLAQVLFRLVKHYQLNTIVELGTSLGITSSYFSKANPGSVIHTIEGSSSIASIAKENFQKLDCSNIQIMHGKFDDVLPSVFAGLSSLDLAYVDGNHRYQPTINYFQQFLPRLNDQSILVFDDIHWSYEMEQAWEEIKAHPSVKYTVDIFFLGFVFFRDEFRVKQHFSVRF